jgi:hypothetical protein
MLVQFAQGDRHYTYTVEAGRESREGEATFLFREHRNFSTRITEVVMHIDSDDACGCKTHGKLGRCRHTAIITHLLHTNRLPPSGDRWQSNYGRPGAPADDEGPGDEQPHERLLAESR